MKFVLKILIVFTILTLLFFPFATNAKGASCSLDPSYKSNIYINNAVQNEYGIYVLDKEYNKLILNINETNNLNSGVLVVEVDPSGPWDKTIVYKYNTSIRTIKIQNLESNAMYKINVYYKCENEESEPYTFIVSTGNPIPKKISSFSINDWWNKLYTKETLKIHWESKGKYMYDVWYRKVGTSSWIHIGTTWNNYIRFSAPFASDFEFKIQAINGPYFSDYTYSKFKILSRYMKYPIVFISGWSGTNIKNGLSCKQPDQDSYFENLDDDLKNDGFNVYYADLTTSPCFTPPIYTNAKRLKLKIAKIKKDLGVNKVILITHSMGGLVARAYIEGPNYADDVSSLIMLGVPNKGIPIDVLFSLFDINLDVCFFQPAMCEMTTIGMSIFNKVYKQNNDIEYHLISGTGDELNMLGELSSKLMFNIPSDGLVPLYSGLGISSVDKFITDENHNVLGPNNYFRIRNDGDKSMSYKRCIKPLLVEDSIINCGTIDFDGNENYSSVDIDLNGQFIVGKSIEIKLDLLDNEATNVVAKIYYPGELEQYVKLTKSDDLYTGSFLIPEEVSSGLGYIEFYMDGNFISTSDFTILDQGLSLNKVKNVLIEPSSKKVSVDISFELINSNLDNLLLFANLVDKNGNILQSSSAEINILESEGIINIIFSDVHGVSVLKPSGLSDIYAINLDTNVPISILSSIKFKSSDISYSNYFKEVVKVDTSIFTVLF